jgi:cytochrome c biogenesis protein CcmG, thiol:disulfide interchange protein DsbE
MVRLTALLACVAAVAAAGCGSESGNSHAKAPASSVQLRAGGKPAFQRELRELRGKPVVVNKWASWCTPCRAEFPFLARQAKKLKGKVAFLGVDAQDVEADARKFLQEEPIPYPSYSDPEQDIAGLFNGKVAFPSTAFYDSRGKLVYLKQGGYASESKLSEDVSRYAR